MPIIGGAFALVFGVLAFLYIQQWQEQNRLRDQNASSLQLLARATSISEDFQAQYDEVESSIPVIESDADEINFGIEVKTDILYMADNAVLFPNLDVDSATNFSVKNISNNTKKIQASIYRVYKYDIRVSNITYDEAMDFIEALENIDTLKTLQVVEATVNGTGLIYELLAVCEITTIDGR